MPVHTGSTRRRAARTSRRLMDPDWAAAEEAADKATREWRVWNPCEPGESAAPHSPAGKGEKAGRS
ncbi:hypothetical protein DIPPA_16167 [Diplonema papillatum]|nr:hypothetical protein DIPPA_16167 [Diplonema papillatum]